MLGVRNMYTPMQFITPLKDSINAGLLDGPYYYAAGRVLEGPEPEFPDWIVVDDVSKIEAALDTLQMEGSDFVQIYSKIPRKVYFDLVKAARKRGMSVEGHLPMSVSALEASRAGQRSFEHLLGVPDVCTHDSLLANKYKYNWFAAVMKEDDYGTLIIVESLALKNFSVLRSNSTYICPTLVVWYNYFHPDEPFESNPMLWGYPKEMQEYWSSSMASIREKNAPWKEMALRKHQNLQKVTYLLYKAGVPMLAGTDAINPYCYPGYSLHTELKLLSECGIPNDEILRMATLNPARFLNLKDQGQVKKGYVASMVLLNQNPLLDISQTQNIDRVILKGKLLEKVYGK